MKGVASQGVNIIYGEGGEPKKVFPDLRAQTSGDVVTYLPT